MAINEIQLLITAITFLVIGCAIITWWSVKSGYFSFVTKFHYYSLVFFLLAGVATWLALIFPVNPNQFDISNKQYVALGMSIIIGVLYWVRYILSISLATQKLEED